MPELPEVEVTRLSFAGRIARRARHQRCASASPCAGRSASRPQQLVGQTVGAGRAARQVPLAAARARRPADAPGHVGIAGASPSGCRRTGRTTTSTSSPTQGTLRLTDPRRFGAVVWSPSAHDAGVAAKLLAGLGLEPFDPRFDGAHLHAALRAAQGRRSSRRCSAATIVVGAGNIYACEALFEAGIDPRTRSDRISRPRARPPGRGGARHPGARASSSAARPCATFATPTAPRGEFQLAGPRLRPRRPALPALRRHGAAHRPGQRSTFFCPGCQRR